MNHLQKTHNLQSKQCNPHQKRLQQEANDYINYNDQNLWSSWNLPQPNLQFTFSSCPNDTFIGADPRTIQDMNMNQFTLEFSAAHVVDGAYD